ncbi:hypothetical protein BDB01DRAFT_844638 [Pilobolus umbonatus]|nr:hypothetical protein BDB01DRAFT_844638 [Pilobolus umbonatus]
MDAISFVLGVSSTHLRSQNLKDMIYRSEALNETATTHTPTGRTPKKAHVTAVYENNQGTEIRFMRSIDSKGKSEYRINNRAVPYSQYDSALAKENILVKAKNFLVFQGDVESVASQSPAELTKLIEQISGSWDYKDEYDELKQKMEEALDNNSHAFNKKRGLLSEMKQYQEQKIHAQKFDALVKDRSDLTAQYLLWKLFHIEEKTNTLEREKNQKFYAQSNAKTDEDSLEHQFRLSREERARVHREKVRSELNIRKIMRELEDQSPNSIAYKEKLIHLAKKMKQIEQNMEHIKRDGQQQEQVVYSLERDIQTLDKTVAEYNESVPKNTSTVQLTTQQLSEYEQLKQQVSQRAVNEQHRIQQLQRQRKTEKQRIDDQQSQLDRLREEETLAVDDLRKATEDRETIVFEANTTADQLNIRKAELKKLEYERTSIYQREVYLNEELQITLNKLMEASIVQRKSDKDTKFNESLSMMKQIYKNVYGKLSDLCKPTQRKYDNAVATVLGRNMDAIVVEDEATAIGCIKYMKEHHIGIATFLPLDSLVTPSVNDKYRNFVKGARLAVDVIKCDKKYEKAIQYACGSTLICDNMNIAKHVCFDLNEPVRAVTLDTTVIHKNGLITGGQSGSQATKTWEDDEVEDLTRNRDKYLAELNELSKKKRMGSAEEMAKSDCASMQAQLDFYADELKTLDSKIEGLMGTLGNIRSKINEVLEPYESSKKALDELDATIKTLESKLAQVEDKVFLDFCSQIQVSNIREYESLQFGISDEVSQRRTQFIQQKSRLETQLSFEKDQLQELVGRLKRLETIHQNDQTTTSQLENELSNMSGKKEELTAKLNTFEVDLKKYGELEVTKQLEINNIQKALEVKGKDVEALMKEVTLIEAEIEKAQAERVAVFRKCQLEGINLPMKKGSMDDVLVEELASQATSSFSNSCSSSMDVDEPLSQLSIKSTDWVVEINYDALGENQRSDSGPAFDRQFQDKIKELTDEINQMAPNLKAIDRLEAVEERMKGSEQEYLITRNASKLAKEQFQNIKQKRYSAFTDAFSHISEQIDRVYKDLTKSPTFPLGGTAYLSVENTEEPYLEGIRYHAMPPMKRFRDMEQLSGGEKSVAALALLFAIHYYKPSPFFVLDEVDAALDNTNVSTVASYIREHATDNFQFIVISLKHTLYEKAQSLVGIYRDQEANSSQTMTLMLDQYAN